MVPIQFLFSYTDLTDSIQNVSDSNNKNNILLPNVKMQPICHDKTNFRQLSKYLGTHYFALDQFRNLPSFTARSKRLLHR